MVIYTSPNVLPGPGESCGGQKRCASWQSGGEGQSAGDGGSSSPPGPGILSSFTDTEMEFSQITQRQRFTLTKTRMKICKFVSEAMMFPRVGAFISIKYSLIIRSSQENELDIRRLVSLVIE